jgi:NAD+ synthase
MLRDRLKLDAESEIARITATLKDQLLGLKRRGCVLGLSGGIDSSVCAALCVRAFGKDRVLGLFMNEADSADDTEHFARRIADHLGVPTVDENITPTLNGAGCYRRRDEAIMTLVPEWGAGWKCKIVLPSVVESDRYRIFRLVARSPEGKEVQARMPPNVYLQVVAATNFKQRTRKMIEYYHADRLVYAVVGTPNRLEWDQGFFVKNGDGAADVKPVAHLYKTQVYQLAEALGIPDEIRRRPPTTDTYSLPQSQEEFYFSLPYDRMDLCLYARDHQIPASEVAAELNLTPEQVERVFRDIDGKRAAARYLHSPPLRID